jgi:hypothetical protein
LDNYGYWNRIYNRKLSIFRSYRFKIECSKIDGELRYAIEKNNISQLLKIPCNGVMSFFLKTGT